MFTQLPPVFWGSLILCAILALPLCNLFRRQRRKRLKIFNALEAQGLDRSRLRAFFGVERPDDWYEQVGPDLKSVALGIQQTLQNLKGWQIEGLYQEAAQVRKDGMMLPVLESGTVAFADREEAIEEAMYQLALSEAV